MKVLLIILPNHSLIESRQCQESKRKRNSDAAHKASWCPGEVSPDPPTFSGPAQTTHQSISTLSSNSTAGKLLLITSVIGDISHDVQEVNLSPLTPVLKDCIQKPENGRRLNTTSPAQHKAYTLTKFMGNFLI